MVIDQDLHDGFEGVGLLVEFFIGIAIVAVLLPIGTALRKLLVDAHRGPVPRGSLVWLSLVVYFLSVILFWRFSGISLTDDVRRIAIWACLGSLVAIAAFVLGLFARGPGRVPAVLQGIYSMVVWLPFFWGRVLLHLHDCGMPLASCR
jgi:uncharacterized membrane protein